MHPSRFSQAGHLSRKPRSVSGLVLRCRNFADWHPILGGCCLALATAILLTGVAALVAAVMPVVGGWAICTPQNGVVLALLLMTRRKHWPWIFAGYAVSLSQGGSVIASSGHLSKIEVFGNLAEVALAAFALPPFRSLKQWLQEPRLPSAFLTYAIVLGPLLLSLTLVHSRPGYEILWGRVGMIALAEGLGMAVATSLTLVLLHAETYAIFRLGALPETVALFSLASASTWFALKYASSPMLRVLVLIAPLAILLIVAFRLGLRAAVLGIALDATVAIAARSHVGDASAATATVQTLLAIAGLLILPLGLTLANKRFVEERLGDAQGELDKLKSLDRLTGVPNRRRFDLVLDREWQRATRDPKPVALIMVDVDDFDLYNQHYGPEAGDECLRHVAARMSDQPHRAYDLISRYAGGKFTVLLPGASGNAVERIAEEFRAEIAAQEWPHERSSFERVTVSVGWAVMIPKSQSRPEALIAAADAALRLAHENGKNRVEGFSANVDLVTPS